MTRSRRGNGVDTCPRVDDHVMIAPPPRAVRSGRAVIAAAATLALGATACGGGNDAAARATPSATPAPPHVVRFCSGNGSGWRGVKAQSNGEAIDAAALGAGPVVVLVNESDNNACAWMAEARALAERGYRAVVFTYVNSDDESASTDDALAVADAVRGGAKVRMMGASVGGRIVFEAAASAPGRLAAIVSLSGERQVQGLPDILPEVRRVRIPVLYVGSRQDPYTEGTRQPRRLQAALPSRAARFHLVAGAQHGVLLLGHAAVRNRIRAFLDAHR